MTAQTQPTTVTTWAIDPSHTLIEFGVKHMMVSTVKGRFTGVEGTITVDEENPANSRTTVTIDAASITTGNEQRDAHLRSADFLDVETYPVITFNSTSVRPTSKTTFEVTGDLTIRGTTREVTLNVELNGRGVSPYGQEVAGLSATTSLNRQEFGLNWNVALEAGGVLVGPTAKVAIELEAVRQA
jgi:polyisoprenoid-binding protein YceI